ncbi:MAG: penicillin-binding protein [Propionibacteriaceae bacterium]|jgi:membrane peptidoglycan carboxypeptidase|nr:penicillin-binding protein [Propionibacteriaceae bacterium]
MVDARKKTPRKRVRKKKKKPLWFRILRVFLIGLLAICLIGVAGVAVMYSYVQMPDPNKDFQTDTTFVTWNDGKTVISSFEIQNRESIPYEEMNTYAVNAVIAAENTTFWTDPGISIPGMIRAGWMALTGEEVTGASTITQQYIKVLYLTQEKTLSRKIKEIFLAAKMGQELPKESILEGYLNTVYYGRGAYGLAAASKAFVTWEETTEVDGVKHKKGTAKEQKDLTLAEAVALICIINNPSLLDPANGEKQEADLLERYQYVLNALVKQGKDGQLKGMTFTEADKAEIYYELPQGILVPPKKSSKMGGTNGFLMNMVENELEEAGYTQEQIRGGGLTIVTTFDKKLQAAAEKAVQEQTNSMAGGSEKKAAEIHGALASIDNYTGEVLAIYGGKDFVENSRNWATTPRPTGSTAKPYALAAAMEYGYTLDQRVNGDQFIPPGATKKITNASGRNYGQISLQTATTNSINAAFVDLLLQMNDGPERMMSAANAAGVPTEAANGWDGSVSIALGSGEISPLRQATGYSTFANLGQRVTPHVVREVRDANGNILYQGQLTKDVGLSEAAAWDVQYALTKVTQDGTGRSAAQVVCANGKRCPIAGKTGTYYNSALDATTAIWFVGFTKQITTAVMYVKGDKGIGDLGNLYGSGYPARTWLAYMNVAMEYGCVIEGLQRGAECEAISLVSASGRKATAKTTAGPKPSAKPKPTDDPTTTPEPTDSPDPEPTDPGPGPGPSPTTEPTTEPEPSPSAGP